MKNASEIMYKIGKIINIVLIPLSAFLIILGVILGAMGAVTASSSTDLTQEEIQAAIALSSSGISMAVVFFFILIFEIVSLIVCTKKKQEIDNGSDEVAPRVFLIVFGVIADNIFYVLAGIFSLVARSQEQNNNQQ